MFNRFSYLCFPPSRRAARCALTADIRSVIAWAFLMLVPRPTLESPDRPSLRSGLFLCWHVILSLLLCVCVVTSPFRNTKFEFRLPFRQLLAAFRNRKFVFCLLRRWSRQRSSWQKIPGSVFSLPGFLLTFHRIVGDNLCADKCERERHGKVKRSQSFSA